MKQLNILFALLILISFSCKKTPPPAPKSKVGTLHIEYDATKATYATEYYSFINIYYTKDGYQNVLYFYTPSSLSNVFVLDTLFTGGQTIKVTGGVVSSDPAKSSIPVMLKVYYEGVKMDSTYCANTSSCSNEITAALPFIK